MASTSVLVPVDFSAPSLNAVLQATRLVDDPERLYTLHVVPAAPGLWRRPDHKDESRIRELMSRPVPCLPSEAGLPQPSSSSPV